MTDHECLFSAVAELNNIAVQLIRHGLYFEAISTLNDAIQVTKGHFCDTDDSSGVSGIRDFSITPRQRANIDQVLHVAQKRKESIHQRGLIQNEMDAVSHPVNILVVSNKDSATEVHRALERSPDFLCCITVDTNFSYMLADGLQLQLTTVFYNYGVALLCVTDTHQEPINNMDTTTTPNILNSRHDATLASSKILKLSHSLISRSIHALDYGDERLYLLIPCCHLMYMLVLYILCHLSRVTSFLSSREVYYNHELKRFLTNLHKMEILHFIETTMASSNVAPAA